MRTRSAPIAKPKSPALAAPAPLVKPDPLRDPLRTEALADPLVKKASPAEVPEIVAAVDAKGAAPESVTPVKAAPVKAVPVKVAPAVVPAASREPVLPA